MERACKPSNGSDGDDLFAVVPTETRGWVRCRCGSHRRCRAPHRCDDAQSWRMRLTPGHKVEFRPLINLRSLNGEESRGTRSGEVETDARIAGQRGFAVGAIHERDALGALFDAAAHDAAQCGAARAVTRGVARKAEPARTRQLVGCEPSHQSRQDTRRDVERKAVEVNFARSRRASSRRRPPLAARHARRHITQA